MDAPDYNRVCNLCGKVLKKPKDLMVHQDAAHQNARYICNECESRRGFTNKAELGKHVDEKHPKKQGGKKNKKKE